MKIYQLRTFHFRSSEVMNALSAQWFEYIVYLEGAGVETHGVFRSPSRPNAIVTLVSFEGEEPELLRAGPSSEFLAGLAGLDIQQIIRADDLPLLPVITF